jgi:hypothetical protein
VCVCVCVFCVCLLIAVVLQVRAWHDWAVVGVDRLSAILSASRLAETVSDFCFDGLSCFVYAVL